MLLVYKACWNFILFFCNRLTQLPLELFCNGPPPPRHCSAASNTVREDIYQIFLKIIIFEWFLVCHPFKKISFPWVLLEGTFSTLCVNSKTNKKSLRTQFKEAWLRVRQGGGQRGGREGGRKRWHLHIYLHTGTGKRIELPVNVALWFLHWSGCIWATCWWHDWSISSSLALALLITLLNIATGEALSGAAVTLLAQWCTLAPPFKPPPPWH